MGAFVRIARSRWRWALLVVLAGGFALIIELGPGSEEPRYQGKALSFWIRNWYYPPPFPRPLRASPALYLALYRKYAHQRQRAERAVHALGTNAVPALCRLLRARDSELKALLSKSQAAQWLLKRGILRQWLEPAWVKNRTAAQLLGGLGPAAEGAVPDLLHCFENNPDRESRRCAAVALGAIGPGAAAAVPALTRVSIVEPGMLHITARHALIAIGSARTNGLPVALRYQSVTNRDEKLRYLMTIDVVDPTAIYGNGSAPWPR
jgi:hypothetical protein